MKVQMSRTAGLWWGLVVLAWSCPVRSAGPQPSSPVPGTEAAPAREWRSPALLYGTYSAAVPLGTTRDWVSLGSFAGAGFDLRYLLTDHLALGIHAGWQRFSERRRSAAELGIVTASGTHVNELSAYPLLAVASYYLGQPRALLHPFASLGIGAYDLERRLELPSAVITDRAWHFGFAPELGVLLDLPVLLVGSLRYQYVLRGDEAPSQMLLSVNLGVGFN